MKSKRLSLQQKRSLEGLAFTTPYIIGTIMFFLFPLIVSIRLVFGEVVKISGFQIKWTGLENLRVLFLEDITFLPMLFKEMGSILIKIPLIIVFSLMLAILISRKIRFRSMFRLIFFMPFIFGQGVVIRLLVGFGITENVFSLQSSSFIPQNIIAYMGPSVSNTVNGFLSIIVTVFWSCSMQMLVFLAGVQAIPEALYESASVDGASEWEKLWKITLPMCIPSIVVSVIFTITDSFTAADNPILELLTTAGIENMQFGYAAAAGWVYCILVLLMVGIAYKMFSKSLKENNQ